MRDLRNKVAVITGASSGIGRATALALAREGACVVLAARRRDPLATLVDECVALGGQALAVPTDVTDELAVQELARAAIDAFGHIDVWINNAAVGGYGLFEDLPPDAFRRVIEVDLFGYVNGSRAALAHFRARRRGVLIQIDSIAGKVPQPYASAYVAAKHAVRAFSDSLREELFLLGEDDISVCTVLPATVDTPFFQHAANYSGRAVRAMPPVYAPEQVARAVMRLVRRPRREVFVGGSGRVMRAIRGLAPGFGEKLFARLVDREHFGHDRDVTDSPGSLFSPQFEGTGVTGGWKAPRTRAQRAIALGAAILLPSIAVPALAFAGASAVRARRRRRLDLVRFIQQRPAGGVLAAGLATILSTMGAGAFALAMRRRTRRRIIERVRVSEPIGTTAGSELAQPNYPPDLSRTGITPAEGVALDAPPTLGNDPPGWLPPR